MILDTIKNLDHQLFQLINQVAFRWEWLDALGVFFARYFVYLMIAALFLFLLKSKKNWKIILISLSSALAARFVTELIRLFKPRPRPFVGNNINLLIDRINQQSFPSGHTSFVFALATVVYLYNRKWGVLFFVGASLVSIGRVFVGVHWPLDILAGIIVGIFSGLLINKLFQKYLG